MLDQLQPHYNKNEVSLLAAVRVTASVGVTAQWHTWVKPRGKRMVHITLVGCGGNGGSGVIGANSVAAGGAGGGGGAVTGLLIPADMLPDVLYYSFPGPGLGTTAASAIAYISLAPTTTLLAVLVSANNGVQGGNGAAGVAGAVAAAAVAATNNAAAAGTMGIFNAFAGPQGTAGGGNGAGVAMSGQPSFVCGGTGGAGLGAVGSAGANGGAINALSPLHPPSPGGLGPVIGSPTTRPGDGSPGIAVRNRNLPIYLGGTGGGATHGTATGAGLVQAAGGEGAMGCGGGGMGGALTGSTPAAIARGGQAFAIIRSW